MYGYSGVYHEGIMENLIKTVHSGENSHAYIFEGAPGVGRRCAAQLFAASIVCENRSLAPCGRCISCIQAKDKSHPDIMYVTSKGKKSIGTDIIRGVVSDAYIKPFEAQSKVYIIEDGEMLTEQAQNSFLKVLEEPPGFAVFIIIVQDSSFLLRTVLSRSVLVRFPPLDREFMLRYIKDKYPDEAEYAGFLASYSCGIPGAVDEAVSDAGFEALRGDAFLMLERLFSYKESSAFEVADFLDGRKADISRILEFWELMLRDIMLLQCGAPELVINSDMRDELSEKAHRIPERVLVSAAEYLITLRKMLKRYVNVQAAGMYAALGVKRALKKAD